MRGSTPVAGPRGTPFVYVVKADSGHVKIGVSTNPLNRLASLQTAQSSPLTMAYVAAVSSGDGYAIEQAAHGILWKHRLNGEWFDATPDLAVAAIAAASHRLGDPIVQIANDKVQFVIDEAARRDASEVWPAKKKPGAFLRALVFSVPIAAPLAWIIPGLAPGFDTAPLVVGLGAGCGIFAGIASLIHKIA